METIYDYRLVHYFVCKCDRKICPVVLRLIMGMLTNKTILAKIE